MVRLKVISDVDISVTKKISIPYGAIKSTGEVPEPVTLKKFQFLMVRLKV